MCSKLSDIGTIVYNGSVEDELLEYLKYVFSIVCMVSVEKCKYAKQYIYAEAGLRAGTLANNIYRDMKQDSKNVLEMTPSMCAIGDTLAVLVDVQKRQGKIAIMTVVGDSDVNIAVACDAEDIQQERLEISDAGFMEVMNEGIHISLKIG